MEHNLDFLKNELFISWKRQELSKLKTQKQKYTTRTGHLDTIFCNLGIKNYEKCVMSVYKQPWMSVDRQAWIGFDDHLTYGHFCLE